ncbi:MAG TPA: DsbA family oxidoreductase [Alphaproteobacteria bacterium]|jgi:predicted DsbA family dithiol-disulfide isomerase|nr:DsbA family oxidoreductase [Alphaproteobacteria bacterium]HJM48701.1 DsbA family oxidoreductase [Alphaproteobacteria bacterium]
MELQIDVVSDTVCPWCLIGKRRFERALAGLPPGLDVKAVLNWRPFQLNPDMPPGGLDRKDYVEGKFGGPEQAQAVFENIRQAGLGEGLDFAFDAIQRTPNTTDSHRLIRWAGSAGCQDAVVEDLFARYFLAGADIGDHAVLTDIAESAGMDAKLVAELLERGDDRDLVAREDATAREMGVNAVPCFIVAQRYVVFGAQEPETFLQLFDLMARENAEAAASEPATV